MDDPAIRLSGLVKEYGRGSSAVRALVEVDLEVERGEVFGFLGPNGAGKSTAIRVMLDQLRPTAGSVQVLGADPRAGGAALRARLGYLPGELAMAGRASAGAYLEHLARLRGGRGRDRIGELAERFSLDLDRRIRGLSKGNKQKVGLIQAFMHDPELLILDEPTSGLDPLLQHEFLAMAREAAQRGATVFMSSHVLREVEAVAERVAIIRAGRIVDLDEVTTLRQHAGQQVVVHFGAPPPTDELERLPGVERIEVEGDLVRCSLHGPPNGLLGVLHRWPVEQLRIVDRELEDLFLDHYRLPVGEEESDDGH